MDYRKTEYLDKRSEAVRKNTLMVPGTNASHDVRCPRELMAPSHYSMHKFLSKQSEVPPEASKH